MKIQGDEISGYESSMGRKFRHENTIYVNEIYEYSIDPFLWLSSAVPNQPEFIQRVDLGTSLFTDCDLGEVIKTDLYVQRWLIAQMKA